MSRPGRPAGIPNKQAPTWAQALQQSVPECFTADGWSRWLAGVVLQIVDRKSLRKAMERGGVPNYCRDCTASHRAQMQQAGRCHPPTKAIDILEESHADAAA